MDIIDIFYNEISKTHDWVYIPNVNIKKIKVFSIENFFPYIYEKYDVDLYIMIVAQLMLSMKEISRYTKSSLDNFKNDSKLKSRFLHQYHTEEEDINNIKAIGEAYGANIIPKQKSFFKRLGKNSNIFEIIIDIDKKTVAGEQNFHSSDNVKKLAKSSPVCIRLFFKLGQEIVVENPDGENYISYKKIVFVLFDKSGMAKEEYNKITSDIIKKINDTDHS